MAEKSVFNRLLIALQARVLDQVADTPAEPGIRNIDRDLGQIDNYTTRPQMAGGANLFVDFPNTDYSQRQLKTQLANIDVLLRLAFDPWGSSSSLSPEDVRQKTLIYFEIEHRLVLALQDWTADGLLVLPMKRIAAVSEKREGDRLSVRQLLFKCQFVDYF